MELSTIEQIERAVDLLAPLQVEELYEWLGRRQGQMLDDRIRVDLDAGRLDDALDRALRDEVAGRVRPL